MVRKFLTALILFCLLTTTAFADNTLLSKGDTYLNSGDKEHAFLAYELAIADSPDDPAVHLHVANAYHSLSDDEQALKFIEQALALDPSYGDAYLLRMKLTMETSPEDAYQDMLRAEILDSVISASDYADLAIALYSVGDTERALKLFSLSGDIAKTEAYRDAYVYTLYATGETDKAATVLGSQSWVDPQISAVVEADKSLCLKEIAVFDPQKQYTVIIPAHIAQNEEIIIDTDSINAMGGVKQSDDSYHIVMTKADIDTMLTDYEVISISPDGNTVLLRADSIWLAIRGDTIMPLFKTQERGAADEYGNLAKVMQTHRYASSAGSVAWSRDGRYFTLTDVKRSLIYMQYYTDLFIFDTSTGEAFLGATYENRFSKGNAGTVIQTVFDDTGRYIYYVLYGQIHEYPVSLMRYDMKTGESVLCYNGPEFAAYPNLRFDHMGRLINIKDTRKSDDMSGLNVYTLSPSGWVNAGITSTVPMALGYPKWLDYSSANHHGLLVRVNRVYGLNLVSVFSMVDNGEGLNQLLTIDSLDANKAFLVDMTEDHIMAQVEQLPATEGAIASYRHKGVRICNAQLSPDGKYAIILADEDDNYRLLLLNMDDLSLRPIECDIGLSLSASFDTALSARYPQGINWVSGTKIIMNTDDGIKLIELCNAE